jgi:hypothetical protein
MEEYKRNCPICNKELTHKHYVSFIASLKKNKPCSKCSNIERANRPEERIKNSQRQLGTRVGKDNHFYGKTHTNKTKELIRVKRAKQLIPKGIDNPLFGKKLEEIVGKEKANNIKTKKSINYTGKGNPMYGKPSPNGSGNGWSGWYNGWFFRSILELSYMIKVINRYNIQWESGENKKYKIEYIDKNGIPRNYFPDFIIAKKYIVEIKPNKLKNTISVLEKRNAAIKHSNKLNMKYKITNVPPLTDIELKELIDTNKIQLTERYIKKYKEKYANKNN